MADKPVFAYWNIRGLGQPIRFLIAYLELDVEEKRYLESDEWLADKESLGMPFPNLPYFLDGSTKVNESRAILKYICRTRKPEMVGKSIQEQTDIDMVDNLMYDLYYCGLVPVCYEYTDERHKNFKETVEPLKLGYLEKFLTGKRWVIGDQITYVDFFTYEVLRALKVYDGKALDKFSNLQSYLDRFESLPAIKTYIASDKYVEKPVFSDYAVVKI